MSTSHVPCVHRITQHDCTIPMTSKDFTNKDLAATQESLHTTQNSLSDCFNEVAVVRSDLERNVADTEARLKNDIRQKQHLGHRFAPSLEVNSCRRCQSEQSVGCMKLCPTSKAGGLREDRCGGTAGRPPSHTWSMFVPFLFRRSSGVRKPPAAWEPWISA